MEGKLNAGDAHLAVNYERILKDGLRGYEKRVKEYKASLDLTDPESIDKYCFYNAVLIVLEAVRNLQRSCTGFSRKRIESRKKD